jgi:transposase-like protein
MAEEYPRSLLELESMFSTEQACRGYLFRLRWPDGFRCSYCGNTEFWTIREIFFRCTACKQRTSVTAGTIFQDTHSPLTVWFRAMWWVTTQKNGASALGLQRILGLKSYETAWTWLHKFRRAMVRPDRELLSGRVEVDECYIGAPEEEMRGRGTADKTLVVVAVEENGSRIGRIRFRQIPNASATDLNRFLLESVAPGSVIHTDGWKGYRKVGSIGYKHEVTVLKGQKEEASELLPRVHLVISLLKRWLMGTHQGAVSHKHLDYYLDEFTFRFNRRKSINRGKLFYRLVQQAVAIEPVPLNSILHPEKYTTRKLPPQKVLDSRNSFDMDTAKVTGTHGRI